LLLVAKTKVIIVTIEDQIAAGKLPPRDESIVDGEQIRCSATMYFGTRHRIAGGAKRYSRSKPKSQQPCQLPATRWIKNKPYCEHHGPGRFHVDPYYDSKAWRELRQQTLDRDNNVCFYCGNSAHQADHVHPRAKGGVDDLSNLVACCSRCNKIARNAEFSGRDAKRNWIRSQIKHTVKITSSRPNADLEAANGDTPLINDYYE
jgi:hypothetical protein